LTSHHTALDELVYARERPGSDEGPQHLETWFCTDPES